jgi:methylated-DNA-[protein]-cysteine S-methyltransferase
MNFALFETAIGTCAIAWGERGVVGVQLPEGDAAKARARIKRRFAGAEEAQPSPAIARAIEAVVALLNGEPTDLSFVEVDMAGIPDLARRVYDIARRIPPGGTLTYGDIAKEVGLQGDAREVGQALGKNPFPIVIPCHRVVAAGGKLGGFSARGGGKPS